MSYIDSIYGFLSESRNTSENHLKLGDKIHLGFGTKGGAGFIGKLSKISDHEVEIKHENGKTYKGPKRFVSKLNEADFVNPLTHVYRITDKGSQRLSTKSTHTEAVAHAKAILKSLPESKLALGDAEGPSHSIDKNGNISKINEEYLDELSRETLRRYIDTGGKSEDSLRLAINKLRKANKAKDFYDKSGYMTKKGPNIGASGKAKKLQKKSSPFRIWDDLEINSNFDQLDELSKETLNRYKYKNIKSQSGIRRNQGHLLANDQGEYAQKLDRAARNRSVGYVRAYKKLNVEEVDDAMLLYSLRQLGEKCDLDTEDLTVELRSAT